MEPQTFFFLGILLGALELYEGFSLKASGGVMGKVEMTTSTLETIWALICIYALFAVSFPEWTIILPAAYISYIIVASMRAPKEMWKIESLEDMKNIRLPVSFAHAGMAFGGLYALASLVAFLSFPAPS